MHIPDSTSVGTTQPIRLQPASPKRPPIAIQAKVIKVAREMPELTKNDTNESGGWKFVSIDDYYRTAAKALLKEGVNWTCVETDFTDHNGLIRWQFEFSLYDVEGNVWENCGRVTVPHEYDGPQAAGKVVSYAEKVFLRQLLKLVTGEPDADVTPQKRAKPSRTQNRSEPPVRIDPPANESGQEISYSDLIAGIKDASTENDLNLFVEKNKKVIARASKNDPDVFKKIAAARTAKLEEFNGSV